MRRLRLPRDVPRRGARNDRASPPGRIGRVTPTSTDTPLLGGLLRRLRRAEYLAELESAAVPSPLPAAPTLPCSGCAHSTPAVPFPGAPGRDQTRCDWCLRNVERDPALRPGDQYISYDRIRERYGRMTLGAR